MRVGESTRYPGVKKIGSGLFHIRGKVIDPRTGLTKEVDQQIEAASAKDAAAERTRLLNESTGPTATKRIRVREFAVSWLESKEGVVGDYTLENYTLALQKHALPILGDYYYDAIGLLEVQAWVNGSLALKKEDGSPRFSVESIKDWFRVFRNMTRDAIAQLGLSRDPTLRVTFRDESRQEDEETNREDTTLSPAELPAFLDAMRKRPSSYALASTLGWTGQRFCHVSALKIGDLDWSEMLVRFRRKQVRGVVGPITKKKPAPKAVPMLPELAEILTGHITRLEKLGYSVGDDNWLFPSKKKTLRTPASLMNAFKDALKAANLDKRISPHKLRYCFNDCLRLAGVDSVTGRSLTGHVTEDMQRHYSTVRIEEKRAAMEAVAKRFRDLKVGSQVGSTPKSSEAA
jgi:integrase